MEKLKLRHFRASHLMQLRNQEFQTAYNEILGVLEDKEITIEYVATAFASAKEESAKLTILRNMAKKHHLTKIISAQRQNRFDYFSLFIATAKSAMKSPIAEHQEAGKVLTEWLEPYRKSLVYPLLAAQTAVAKEMTDEVSVLARIDGAIDTLNLTMVFNAIKSITSDIITNIHVRSKELAEESRTATATKRAAYAKMMIFLNSIEMVINLNDENKAEYMDYVKRINRFLDFYEAGVISRSTRFKNAALKEEDEVQDDVDSDTGDETERTIETTRSTSKPRVAVDTTPYSVITLNEDVDMDMQTVETVDENSTATDDALNKGVIKNDTEQLAQNGADNFNQDS